MPLNGDGAVWDDEIDLDDEDYTKDIDDEWRALEADEDFNLYSDRAASS